MAACHQLRFDVTGNSAIRSADRPWKPYPRTKHNVSPYLSWSVLLCSCFLLQTIITRSQAVDRIADRTQHSTFRVTWRDWRHRSRDHLIAHIPFPNGSPLEQSLSPAVFEILRSKRIRVTSLTFQGHVTSFDSPYAISCWWSFGTKPLSLIVLRGTTDFASR